MRAACAIANIFLLSLTIGCSQKLQSRQNTEQSSQAQPQSQPSVPKSERGTPAEANAMLQKAVEHFNSVGRKQALEDFTGEKPPFVDRDLYVVCIGSDRHITANGGFPQYVGASVNVMKDADGKPLGQAILDAASSIGEGSVKYRWINPVSHKMEPKVFFGRKVGEDVCGVGAYNPQ